MTENEFLEKFKDILQTEENLTLDTNLLDIEEWDSLAIITTVAFIDKEFGKKITVAELQDCDLISDILTKVKI